jgi:hypothetical protein
MSSVSQAKHSTSPGGSQLPQHAPMSERQQLALIKRLELQASASPGPTNNGKTPKFANINIFCLRKSSLIDDSCLGCQGLSRRPS